MDHRFTLSDHLHGERLFGLSLADAVRRTAALAGGAIHIGLENEAVVIRSAFGEILAESEHHYVARLETEMFAAVDLGDIPIAKVRAADLEKIKPFPVFSPVSSVLQASRAFCGSGNP